MLEETLRRGMRWVLLFEISVFAIIALIIYVLLQHSHYDLILPIPSPDELCWPAGTYICRYGYMAVPPQASILGIPQSEIGPPGPVLPIMEIVVGPTGETGYGGSVPCLSPVNLCLKEELDTS